MVGRMLTATSWPYEWRAKEMANSRDVTDDVGRTAETIDATVEAVLRVVRDLVVELHPAMVDPRLVRLDSDLDRDLALDSLSRAELLLRLDRRFKVQLPESLIGAADCPEQSRESDPRDQPRDRRDGKTSPAGEAEPRADRRTDRSQDFD